jgi:hypothetical protein
MDAKDIRNIQEAYLSVYQNIDEVKGYGGHVDPNTGKSSGLRSPSQQAHATHWRNRQQGKDVPDPRRSKFKYGGSKGSTTGAHEGEPPEDFAKKQDPDLAMTPAARMKARATSLAAKGKTKQANKIRSVMNRPNMSESYQEAEIASEYFYEMGFNEYGIDILIEELGVEQFSEWVDEIIEECTLTEARAAKRRTGGKSYAEVKAEIDAKEAAKAKARKPAVTAAQTKQPETKATPTQTKQGIGARIGAAFKAAGERAKQDTELLRKSVETARGVAARRGAEAAAVYDALRAKGREAEQSPQATRARRKATVAAGRAVQAAAPVAKKAAMAAAGAAGAGAGSLKAGKSPVAAAGRAAGTFVRKMRAEEYDYILSHLLDEGYANNLENAEVILMNMSESWFDDILDEGFKRMDRSKIRRQVNRLGGDRGEILSMLASKLDTPVERKYSTSQARKNRTKSGEYRQLQHKRAAADAQSDFKKYGMK